MKTSGMQLFVEELSEKRIIYKTGVDGLYGLSSLFDRIASAIGRKLSDIGHSDGVETIRFPPGMARQSFERSGYMKKFANLAGTVHCFCGGESEYRELIQCFDACEDWTSMQRSTDIVLVPAACYPIYPLVAQRGVLSDHGEFFEIQSYCFRREPSRDPMRLQMFRMHEFVFIGPEERAISFRNDWIGRAKEIMQGLKLPNDVIAASDPFFGKAGPILSDNQIRHGLKLEMTIAMFSGNKPTACASFNFHSNYFGSTFQIIQNNGQEACSACVGFGLERLTFALLRYHGTSTDDWPPEVLSYLMY